MAPRSQRAHDRALDTYLRAAYEYRSAGCGAYELLDQVPQNIAVPVLSEAFAHQPCAEQRLSIICNIRDPYAEDTDTFLPLITAGCRDEDAKVRKQSLLFLLDTEDLTAPLASLIELLHDPHPDVASEAAAYVTDNLELFRQLLECDDTKVRALSKQAIRAAQEEQPTHSNSH